MARSGKKVAMFVTIPNVDFPGLYELAEVREQVPNSGDFTNLNCPCCGHRMKPVFDIQQRGFWQDHYQTWFACRDCLKVIEFVYELSLIEPTKPKRQLERPDEVRFKAKRTSRTRSNGI